MPKTRFQEYDRKRMSELAERILRLAERYKAIAEQMTFAIDLPNQATLDSALRDIRTHLGRAELTVANFLDDLSHKHLGNSVAAEAKATYEKQTSKKTKKPST